MESEIASGGEDATAARKHKLKIRRVAKCRRTNAKAAGWRRPSTTDPAAPMQLDLVAARRVRPHGLVTIGREEEVTMIGRNH